MSSSSRDSAKKTFDRAIERARYIQMLARGLTDHRKRRVRRDWAKNFKRLMQWPVGSNIERVDSKDVVLVLRHSSPLDPEHFSSEALDDLLRASYVMTLSAMDAYFHAKIVGRVVQHAKVTEPSDGLLNCKILVSDFIAGQKKYKRKYQALRTAIERTLSYQSLQAPNRIADGLCLIGVGDFWTSVASNLEKDKKKLVANIKSIVRRRNQIAHEGDVSQSKKTRNKSRAIGHKDVADAISLVCDVVDAAEQIISESGKKSSKKPEAKKGKKPKAKKGKK